MTNHPPQPSGAPREVIRADYGGWISGPSISTETVAADRVAVGDVLDIDGVAGRVTGRRCGDFRIGGTLQPGIALDWHQVNGAASGGTLFRRPGDVLGRLWHGERRA